MNIEVQADNGYGNVDTLTHEDCNFTVDDRGVLVVASKKNYAVVALYAPGVWRSAYEV